MLLIFNVMRFHGDQSRSVTAEFLRSWRSLQPRADQTHHLIHIGSRVRDVNNHLSVWCWTGHRGPSARRNAGHYKAPNLPSSISQKETRRDRRCTASDFIETYNRNGDSLCTNRLVVLHSTKSLIAPLDLHHTRRSLVGIATALQ